MAALGEIHLRINSEKLEGDIRKAVKAALLGVFQDLQKYLEVEPDKPRRATVSGGPVITDGA
jgi:hypothetical protein